MWRETETSSHPTPPPSPLPPPTPHLRGGPNPPARPRRLHAAPCYLGPRWERAVSAPPAAKPQNKQPAWARSQNPRASRPNRLTLVWTRKACDKEHATGFPVLGWRGRDRPTKRACARPFTPLPSSSLFRRGVATTTTNSRLARRRRVDGFLHTAPARTALRRARRSALRAPPPCAQQRLARRETLFLVPQRLRGRARLPDPQDRARRAHTPCRPFRAEWVRKSGRRGIANLATALPA